MSQSQIRIVAALFAVVLLAIVAAANFGAAESYFAYVRAFPLGDKIAHVCLLGTMSFLLNLSLGARRFETVPYRPLRGTLILLVLVTCEEFSQALSIYRTFDWGDLTANSIGILLGGCLAALQTDRRVTEG